MQAVRPSTLQPHCNMHFLILSRGRLSDDLVEKSSVLQWNTDALWHVIVPILILSRT